MPAPPLTDAAIRAAIRTTASTGKGRTLRDAGRRGDGRLVLMLRAMPAGPLAEWYAQAFANGRRELAKLGTFPAMPLAQARARFSDWSAAIRDGQSLKEHKRRRYLEHPGKATLGELLLAYVEHLEYRQAASAPDVRRALLGGPTLKPGSVCALEALGPDLLACDVTRADVIRWLAPIHARAPGHAIKCRAHLSAAYSWAIRQAGSYTGESAGRDFGVESNPVAGVSKAPSRPASDGRHLSECELRQFWHWLASPQAATYSEAARDALRVLYATGQRVQEISRATVDQFDPVTGWLAIPKTKTGKPHAIPLPPIAAAIVRARCEGRAPGEPIFPAPRAATGGPSESLLEQVCRRASKSLNLPRFFPRAARRTFRTLAGEFLPAEHLARYQNHALPEFSGVAERHYARGAYAPQKQAVADAWGKYLDSLVAG